jgi:two-component system, OmpR family, sensor kinase
MNKQESSRPDDAPSLRTTLEQLLSLDATEVRTTLRRAATLIADALDAEKVDVLLYEAASDSLVALGVSDTPLARLEQARGLDRMPLANEGRAVEVFRTGVARYDGFVDQDEQELIGVRAGLGVRSTVITPLIVGDERRGAITVASTENERFSPDNLEWMRAVTHWVGMVLHRAELVETIASDAVAMGRRAVAEELITTLAHDFRTPLTPLRGNLEILRVRAQNEARADDLRLLDATLRIVQRMEGMTTDMLDASRIESGIFMLAPQSVDLGVLLGEAADEFNAGKPRVEVRAAEPLVIMGDPQRLRQLFDNLLANAIRYAPDTVPVVVELLAQRDSHGRWAVTTIRDEGPGIPAELQPILFDRFAIGRQASGLGLGLYLARGIAEAHGGSLAVDSVFGQGATFTVRLPI